MNKIALIQPKFKNKELDRNIKTVYPIGLGYLASYISDDWNINIIDEQIEQIDFNIKYDIVGITTTTLTINRAYELCEIYKKMNTKVILGGVHASVCPDEAIKYCDAVCIGDGENVINQILTDYKNKKMKKKYFGNQPELINLRNPRRDLFKNEYSFLPVSTSRGCPFNCNFCAINKFYNGSYRKREVSDVIKEMIDLPQNNKVLFICDGNMYGYSKEDRNRFIEICKNIYNKRKSGKITFKYFMCYASINILDDLEALDMAQKAGCIALFIGFESINPDSLKDMNKKLNLKYGVNSYTELILNAKKRNILIVGEMIIGNDSDDKEVLEKTEDFLNKINFDILRLQILQPLPGTKLFKSLKNEGRLFLNNFPDDWDKISTGFTTGIHYEPKNIDKEYLRKWLKRVGLNFYSISNILKRAFKGFIITKSMKLALLVIIMNFKSKKTYLNMKI